MTNQWIIKKIKIKNKIFELNQILRFLVMTLVVVAFFPTPKILDFSFTFLFIILFI